MAEDVTVRRSAVRQPVIAEWACIGKRPGDGDAYGVLQTSVGDTDFGQYAGRYVTGTPSSDLPANAPGALPWITFGTFNKEAAGRVIAVTISDSWQGRDRGRRRILPQRLFLFRYAQLAEVGASYLQLWRALEHVTLPADDHMPMAIDLRPQSIDDLIATIESYGVKRMIALAGLVLEGRIALAGTAELARDARLAALDAVAALLPYGFRSFLTAGSAADNKLAHGLDLVFAEFPNDQILVPLPTGARIPATGSDLGRRYVDMLLDKQQTLGLRVVVEYLWHSRDVVSPKQPEAALIILAKLDSEGTFLRRLDSGKATTADVNAFFRQDPATVAASWRSEGMTLSRRRRALRLALGQATGTTVQLLGPHWQALAADVFGYASAGLNADQPAQPARAVQCLELARSAAGAEAEDRFLAKLIDSAEVAGGTGQDRRQALVGLLRRGGAPGHGQFSHTRQQFRHDHTQRWPADLTRSLLGSYFTGDGDHRDEAVAWARWLCGQDHEPYEPQWITVLRLSVGPDVGIRAQLDGDDPPWVTLLLRLAGRCARFPQFLREVDQDLLEMSVSLAEATALPDGADRRRNQHHLLLQAVGADMWQAGVKANTIAVVDASRALLDGQPADFPAERTKAETDGYFDGLNYVFEQAFIERWRAALARKILSQAVPRKQEESRSAGAIRLLNSWSSDPDLARIVASYILEMPNDLRPRGQGLEPGYWDNLAPIDELRGYVSTQRLAIAVRAAVQHPKQALARKVAAAGVTNSQLALACYGVRLAGMRASDIILTFRENGAHVLGPQQVDQVLRELQALLLHTIDDPRETEDDLFLAYNSIFSGDLGKDFGIEFRAYLKARFREDRKVRKDWLRLLRKTKISRSSRSADGAASKIRRIFHANGTAVQ